MSILYPDISWLAEENPAQYYELMNAFQQMNTQLELEVKFAESMAKYADYEVIPNVAQGHTFINAGTRLAGEYMGPVSSSTETALELATDAFDYEVLDVNGQILYRGNMGALKTAGSGAAYQSTSLLAMDVGVVGAAVAPVLGVALGAGLYQNNPEFWTKLSQKLLPFCYPGTTEIPAWLDIVESAVSPGTYESNVIIDKRVILAIQELFEQEGIGVTGEEGVDGPITVSGSTLTGPIQCLSISPGEEKVIGLSTFGGVSTVHNGSSTRDLKVCLDVESGKLLVAQNDSGSGIAKIYSYDAIGTLKASTFSIDDYYATIDGNTAVYNTFDLENSHISRITCPTSTTGSTSFLSKLAWYLVFGTLEEIFNVPEGTSKWGGNNPALTEYTKSIIYMVEDPNNPGSFIPEEAAGISIAMPNYGDRPKPKAQTSKPENWPEGVDWPTTIDFPWEKPSDYDGDWPETMEWPLPANRPSYWPDILQYPNLFDYPASSVDPEENPDPNKNNDYKKPTEFIQKSLPGTNTDPAEDPQPDPEVDPSIPGGVIAPVIPVDPPGTPGVPDPPVDEGEGPVPVVPTIPIPFTSANDGLISVYHPTDAQLKAFASWLWVTYADPSIDKLWNNPFDGVIGLMEIYCTPTDNGYKNIRSGFLDSGINSATISRYTEIDCGSIYIPEYYNNYLDYSPYSKAHVYLPFIGIVELNVDDVVGHAVNINYKIDEYNGSCIAQITCAKHSEVNGEDVDYSAVVYQFSGNCAVELPLAGGTQSAIRAGLIQAAAYGLSSVIGGVVSGVSGNIGAGISQIGYGAANAIGSVVSAKSSVQHSGSFGSSFGALGIKTPFIIISRPKQLCVLNYPLEYGYPAHACVTIGACSGYLRVREVHVKSATATDEEKTKIEELLKAGVFV